MTGCTSLNRADALATLARDNHNCTPHVEKNGREQEEVSTAPQGPTEEAATGLG